jgi:hypothetical protein
VSLSAAGRRRWRLGGAGRRRRRRRSRWRRWRQRRRQEGRSRWGQVADGVPTRWDDCREFEDAYVVVIPVGTVADGGQQRSAGAGRGRLLATNRASARVVDPLVVDAVKGGGVEVVPHASGHGRGAWNGVEAATRRRRDSTVAEAAQERGGGQGAPVDDDLISAGRKEVPPARKLGAGEDGAGSHLGGRRVGHMGLTGGKARGAGAAIGAVGAEGAARAPLGARAAVVAFAVGGPDTRLAAPTGRKVRSVGRFEGIACVQVVEEHDCPGIGVIMLQVDDGALALIQQRRGRWERRRRRRGRRRRSLGRRRRILRRQRRRARRRRRGRNRRRRRRRKHHVTRAAVGAIRAHGAQRKLGARTSVVAHAVRCRAKTVRFRGWRWGRALRRERRRWRRGAHSPAPRSY